jgi:hypothetical protein
MWMQPPFGSGGVEQPDAGRMVLPAIRRGIYVMLERRNDRFRVQREAVRRNVVMDSQFATKDSLLGQIETVEVDHQDAGVVALRHLRSDLRSVGETNVAEATTPAPVWLDAQALDQHYGESLCSVIGDHNLDCRPTASLSGTREKRYIQRA